jgi:hypothetical protein
VKAAIEAAKLRDTAANPAHGIVSRRLFTELPAAQTLEQIEALLPFSSLS